MSSISKKSWVVVAGPTASGKSSLGMALALDLGGEIIGCDSIQVYKDFDVGSAKPTRDEMGEIRHHLIDVVSWREDFDTGKYSILARGALDEIRSRGKLPVVVGGSGLYLRALFGQQWHGELPKDDALRAKLDQRDLAQLYLELQSLDPDRAADLHPNDKFRIVRALELVTLLGHPLKDLKSETQEVSSSAYVIVLDPPRDALHSAIATRTDAMLDGGLLEETRRIIEQGCPLEAKPMQSIGYRQASAVASGQEAESEMGALILAATRQYAKRQTTWFRSIQADERLIGQPGSYTGSYTGSHSGSAYSELLARIQLAIV